MPKTKKLENKISKKLEKLQKLADKVQVIQILNSDDPDTWDSDTLHDLVEQLKAALQILEDKKHQKEKDPWGEPLILEEGLCSLVDEYHSDEEENKDI